MVLRVPVVCLALALVTQAPARAAPPSHVDVRAHLVSLYPGATPLIAADGRVVVHAGKWTIWADSVRYDLNKNRLVASGNVAVESPGSPLHLAAYALDLTSDSATAISLEGESPQTLVINGKDAQPIVGPAPAGVFDLSDLNGIHSAVHGPHAVITPNASVRFAPAMVLTDLGPSLPAPSYLFTFNPNPSFAQQSLPGSAFDQPYGLFGTPNALASLHFLYSAGSGFAIGLDAHLVNKSKSYVVASLLPTVSGGRLDLIGFEQLNPTMSQQLTLARQAGYAGGQYVLLHNEAASVTSLTLTQVQGIQAADLRLSTLTRTIPNLFAYKLSGGIGYDHQNGLLPYPSDSRATLEGLATTPTLHLPWAWSFSGAFDMQTTIYNYPRQTGTTLLSTYFSKRLTRTVNLLAQVQFAQVYDRYANGQTFFYPPQTPVLADGSVYYGYAAYNGSSTQRAYSLTTTYSPNASFNLQIAFIHHRDFPQFNGYGNPPYSLGFDLRVRPPSGPTIELGRAYIFNWGEQRFSPAYTLSIAP